ncbi:MAG: hypothetical protein MMC23_010140 [Stictis urceolatum]|nr:hypothetical protein [Stictis urceolata]
MTILDQQLPYPSSSDFKRETQSRKRKLSDLEVETFEETAPKRPRVTDHSTQTERLPHDPIAYWLVHNQWPESFGQEGEAMPPRSTSNSKSTSQDSSNKRKSESTHRTDYLERLEEHGIYMKTSTQMQKASKELCTTYLQDNREPTQWSCFPREKIPQVLERIESLSESRIQRDVMPWVVPSAENLFFSEELQEDWIGDEVQTNWSMCQTLGGTRPKPDYTAGLRRKAFTKDEIRKLLNHSAPSQPFLFTPELSFPFLICEAKSGDEGLNKARRQNIHSASIAVNAIIELYKAAYGGSDPSQVEGLYGQVLVFTVSHSHSVVYLYGHYAVPADDSKRLEFYRYEIALFSLSLDDGRDRYRAYSFVRNIYEKFAPEHRKRIKDAAAQLELPGERTGLSFDAFSLLLEEGDSQPNSQDTVSQADSAFLLPGTPASASRNN